MTLSRSSAVSPDTFVPFPGSMLRFDDFAVFHRYFSVTVDASDDMPFRRRVGPPVLDERHPLCTCFAPIDDNRHEQPPSHRGASSNASSSLTWRPSSTNR